MEHVDVACIRKRKAKIYGEGKAKTETKNCKERSWLGSNLGFMPQRNVFVSNMICLSDDFDVEESQTKSLEKIRSSAPPPRRLLDKKPGNS
jgi:hypothetical protein